LAIALIMPSTSLIAADDSPSRATVALASSARATASAPAVLAAAALRAI
jgi:hypothetical protein